MQKGKSGHNGETVTYPIPMARKRKKKSAPGLSFRQLWMLAWVIPLIGVLLFLRDANLSRHRQQSPGWKAIESVRTGSAVPPAAQPSKNPGVTPPVILEKPIVPGEPAAAALPAGALGASGATLTEKVSVYENKDFGYGFQMPYGAYWQGFGERDGAKHSVGISRTAAPASFESSDVKLWYYPNRDVPVEGHSGLFQDPQSGKTYFAVPNGLPNGPGTDLFVIQAPSFDDKILGKILSTIYLK